MLELGLSTPWTPYKSNKLLSGIITKGINSEAKNPDPASSPEIEKDFDITPNG
jgi:hypothetical protein